MNRPDAKHVYRDAESAPPPESLLKQVLSATVSRPNGELEGAVGKLAAQYRQYEWTSAPVGRAVVQTVLADWFRGAGIHPDHQHTLALEVSDALCADAATNRRLVQWWNHLRRNSP